MLCNNNNSSICPICAVPADKMCSGCKSVAYCSAEHQKLDWKRHRQHCQIYTIMSNDKFGRYVVAARNITPGTIIMDEEAISFGPKQETLPMCLGCHKLLMLGTETRYSCSKCSMPLCGVDCEKIPAHADNECKIFAQNRVQVGTVANNYQDHHPIYECIFTLRCLLLKKANPRKWAQLSAMTDQNENRKAKLPYLWYRNQLNTVRAISQDCGLGNEFSELEIHSAIGWIDVNAFEVTVHGYDISGLFNNTYIMSHDCVSNTHHTFTQDTRMVVRASVFIKKGDQITTSYASNLDGTLERSQEISESKFFTCDCRRCSDPTELGTYLSAIKCTAGADGCSGYVLSAAPLEPDSKWRCGTCQAVLPVDRVKEITEAIRAEISLVEQQPAATATSAAASMSMIPTLEALIKKYNGILHPNHCLMIQIMHSLLSLYGRSNGWLVHELDLAALKRMEEVCLALLKVADVIEPGLSRFRGFILYQLQAAISYIAQKELENGTILKPVFQERLSHVLTLLNESKQILSQDGSHTPEGIIVKAIPKNVQDVQHVLAQLGS